MLASSAALVLVTATAIFAASLIEQAWRSEKAFARAERLQRQRAEHSEKLARDSEAQAIAATESAQWNEYAAKMHAADLSLRVGDDGYTERLLESLPPTRRGWEHDYLMTQLHRRRLTLPLDATDQSTVSLVTLDDTSPNQVAAAGYDGVIRIWNITQTVRRLHPCLSR